MALLTLPAPRTPDPYAAPVVRWGILGTGWIAHQFVATVLARTGQRVVAVGSRSAERSREFAGEFGIEQAFGSYEELVGAEVDVIYVATGHLDHLAHATLALEAGKPVLVEKPMTPRVDAVRTVPVSLGFDAVLQQGLYRLRMRVVDMPSLEQTTILSRQDGHLSFEVVDDCRERFTGLFPLPMDIRVGA